MAIPAYMWLKDDGGSVIKGSVQDRTPRLGLRKKTPSSSALLPLYLARILGEGHASSTNPCELTACSTLTQ